ncbi:hypothetical protein [Pumilibacter intestinalis]|uniref:hypothetical protein n=1 Tax=Pumilibacter intestinalis TaxID=2941511 RepID=UPI00203E3518|nr:hypothetical protein [Pumilibacter intestinalis]
MAKIKYPSLNSHEKEQKFTVFAKISSKFNKSRKIALYLIALKTAKIHAFQKNNLKNFCRCLQAKALYHTENNFAVTFMGSFGLQSNNAAHNVSGVFGK